MSDTLGIWLGSQAGGGSSVEAAMANLFMYDQPMSEAQAESQHRALLWADILPADEEWRGATSTMTITYEYDPLYRLTSASYSAGAEYEYTYDAVGNRQTMTSPEGQVSYTYDAANRLTSVGGVAYTWDDNGNLTSDAVRSYAYDHANRPTQVVSGTLTTQYAYNGDAARTSKTVAGNTTEYVLDLAATLPVVISDTDAVYLYGLDIIAQQQAEMLYYMHDGLGSVRQLLDATGEVQTSYAYDPFGVPLAGGDVSNPYQYTGEAWDAEAELLYLRARYYQPEVGRFITKDAWAGDVWRPGSLNHYLYVLDDPVNRVDPSGLEGPDPHGTMDGEWREPAGPTTIAVPPGYPSDFVDHRDLTVWLWQELHANGLEAMLTMRPFRDIPYPGCRSLWLALWVRRVADDHTWDFKDQIRTKLGDAVMLRGSGDAYGWYEFSLPGNINFGYAGRAAGFPGLALHIGASFAEITDRAHKESGEATCLIPAVPDGACPSLLEIYLNPEWQNTLYDNLADWESVEFGVQLWEEHPVGLTLDQFRSFLSEHVGMLTGSVQTLPSNAGEYRDPHRQWPYRRGYFNGPRSDIVPFG